MPILGKKSKLGKIGSVRNFVNVVREINFDEIRTNADMSPRLLILAASDDDAVRVGETITAMPRSPYIFTGTFDPLPRSADPYDAIVVYDPTNPQRANQISKSTRAEDLGIPVVAFESSNTFDARAAANVRQAIVTQNPDRAPALGRHLPAFRQAAVKAITDETARANAQFALVSNAPAVIPVLGGFISAGTDMLVLTKNQVMMILKIAAIHDRDLHNQRRILQEVAPVIGAGFLWRTLAREAASFLPLLIGTLPKVGVAFVGTMAAGYGADFYYRFGRKPTREQMRGIYQRAADVVKQLPIPLTGGTTDDAA